MSNTWEETTIGNMFDIGAGKSVGPSARHGEPKYPFLRTSNIFWGEIDTKVVDKMHFNDNEIASKSLKKGDLLVCEGGDIGRSAIWSGQMEKCSFQNHLHRLRPKSSDIIPRFYMYYLQAGFTQLGIYAGAGNKTTIPNLSKNGLANLAVPKPSKSEQQKIAAILWKVQQAIKIEEKLIITGRELKKSAMQQLFTKGLRGEKQQETEIGLVPESWKVDKIGSRCEKPEYGVTASATTELKGPKFLRITDITESGVNWNTVPYCECSSKEEESKRLYNNDILFARIGATTGKSFIVKDPPKSVFASYLIRVRPKPDVDADYLYHFFNSSEYWQQVNANKGNNLKGGVNGSILATMLFPVPPILEQKEIAEILQAIDHKISFHERKKSTLQELFQSLLNNLMTGEIRVNDLDIDVSEVTNHFPDASKMVNSISTLK